MHPNESRNLLKVRSHPWYKWSGEHPYCKLLIVEPCELHQSKTLQIGLWWGCGVFVCQNVLGRKYVNKGSHRVELAIGTISLPLVTHSCTWLDENCTETQFHAGLSIECFRYSYGSNYYSFLLKAWFKFGIPNRLYNFFSHRDTNQQDIKIN